MKIFISGANPLNENYQSAIEQLQIRLSEFGLDAKMESSNVFMSYQDVLKSDCAYFIDGWFDLQNSRQAFETCHNHGIPVLFEKPQPYYADFAQTFDLLKAIHKITGVSFDAMRSPAKEEKMFFARCIYAWVCVDYYKIKPTRVGKILNRDYSTIRHQIDSCMSLIESPCDKGFKEQCNAVYEEMFGKKTFWDYNSNKAPFVDAWNAGDEYYQNLERLDWKEVFGWRF